MSLGLLVAAIAGQEDILSASVSPSIIDDSQDTCPIVRGPATASGAGGFPPYAYLWEIVSGAGILINSPTSQSTTFSKNGPGFSNAIIRCTVTDQNSDFATDTISVSLECGLL